jgi:hypothetical protein
MQEASPNPVPITTAFPGSVQGEKRKRKYVLSRQGRLSERALRARRANLRKARGAPKELLYRPTEKRQAASRANLAKAIAARRSATGNAAARLNALKHGLYARLVPGGVERLAEDPKAFAEHLRAFERVYAPQDEEERKLVRRLAETVWRRLRLFRAQAHWEEERLKTLFKLAPEGGRLSVEESERRAYALTRVLFDYDHLFREAMKIHAQVERALRRLLADRSGGTIRFKLLSVARESKRETTWDEAWERWEQMESKERAALAKNLGTKKQGLGAGG